MSNLLMSVGYLKSPTSNTMLAWIRPNSVSFLKLDTSVFGAYIFSIMKSLGWIFLLIHAKCLSFFFWIVLDWSLFVTYKSYDSSELEIVQVCDALSEWVMLTWVLPCQGLQDRRPMESVKTNDDEAQWDDTIFFVRLNLSVYVKLISECRVSNYWLLLEVPAPYYQI